MEKMAKGQRRLEREKKTIAAMLHLYCADQHGNRSGLCESCEALQNYTLGRLDRCPYLPEKPTCLQCTTHCYKAEQRAQIRIVMRYAGPRMMWRYPVLAIWHVWDERRRRL